jgi:uncharacterized protein YjbI with pentapeptide repeats
MLIEIKHRYTHNVLYACEAENMQEAVIQAIQKKADLLGAYLQDADLRGADLRGADLRGAYLRGAYLRGAYLRGADLQDADLRGADLRGADLRGEIIFICPIFIKGLIWDVCITESFMQIGCERHEHTEWSSFSDDYISQMESRASQFWAANKSWLLLACKAHHKESLAARKAKNET